MKTLGICATAIAATLAIAQQPDANRDSGKPDDGPVLQQLDMQYATAKLKLAQANLTRVEQMNQRVSNSVPADVIADFRRDVAVAQTRLDETNRGVAESFAVWLQESQRAWKSADTNWRSATAANQRQPDTIRAVDVERLQLRAAVFRANYERGAALADQPRDVQLAWRVSVMNDQLEQMSEIVLRGSPTRPGRPVSEYRYWDYYYLPPALR